MNTSAMRKVAPKYARHVLIVEDEHLLRDLLARTLETLGFDVTTAATAADAKRAVKSADPDVMVVDIELGPGPTGLDLAEVIQRQRPEIGIVFLTNLPDPRFSGKDKKSVTKNQAYIRKSQIKSGAELVDAVEAVLRERVTDEHRHDLSNSSPITELSRRQLDTLDLVAQGKTNAQIAELRGTSVRAVEAMLSRIFQSLSINSDQGNARVEAASIYKKYKAS